MTIDDLIEICKQESERSGGSEFDYGYTVAYKQVLKLAREVKLSMLKNSTKGVTI